LVFLPEESLQLLPELGQLANRHARSEEELVRVADQHQPEVKCLEKQKLMIRKPYFLLE
jgi:hypothetical protein